MREIRLYNDSMTCATCIPNAFIDRYMADADGEFVKIFLYLLRCQNQPARSFSLSEAADFFEHTEKDILRALHYWEKKGLLELRYNDRGKLRGIRVCSEKFADTQTEEASDSAENASDAQTVIANGQAESAQEADSKKDLAGASGKEQESSGNVTDAFIRAVSGQPHTGSPVEMARFSERSDVRMLIFIAEQYLGRTLSQTDLSYIFYWHDQFSLSTELIEYLMEQCISRGHTSIYYMQKVAEGMAQSQITTMEQAREYFDQSSDAGRVTARAFGISGRVLAPVELEYVKRWSEEMGFSTDMIEEACRRTIEATHNPSFKYADSILSEWKKQGITTAEALEKADEAYKKTKKPYVSAGSARSASGFNNFQQRANDYEELQKKLIQKSLQS